MELFSLDLNKKLVQPPDSTIQIFRIRVLDRMYRNVDQDRRRTATLRS